MGYRPNIIGALGRVILGVIVILILTHLFGYLWTVMLGFTWQAPTAQLSSNTDNNFNF